MDYKLIDLHCDTASRMYKEKKPLRSNDLHIALDKASGFKKYVQVAAIWSDNTLSDEEAYSDFWRILNNFKMEIEANRQSAVLCRSFDDLTQVPDGAAAFFLAVEDARLVSGNVERMHELYDAGVRIISLNWQGENALGGGYDTNAPLTHLGRTVAAMALDLGMVPDVSHSSTRVTEEIADMAAAAHRPFIATHSASSSIARHPRNLTDEQLMRISASGGIVGVPLVGPHLCDVSTRRATISDVINHIEYFLGLDGQHTVCLGCDFDGTDSLPVEIDSIATLYRLADAMSARNFSDELIGAIFYQNAYNFLKRMF